MNIYTPDNSDQMAEAVYNTYLNHCINLEMRIFDLAHRVTQAEVSSLEFWEEGSFGLWVPQLDVEKASVECMGSQCVVEMDKATFGAALTLMAINHEIWHLHDAGEDFAYLSKLQDDITDYVYREGSQFDAGLVATFLD